MLFDLVVAILKIAGATISGALGIAGVLYNFKKRQKLTKHGRWVIAGIVISSLVAIAATIAEDVKGREESERIRNELTKLLNPLTDLTLYISVAFERGPGVLEYIKSKKHLIERFSPPPHSLAIEPTDLHWPKSGPFAEAISNLDGCLLAFIGEESGADRFFAIGKSRPLVLHFTDWRIQIDYEIVFDPKYIIQSSQIDSAIQFKKATLRFFWCTNKHTVISGSYIPILDPKTWELAQEFELENATIAVSKSRYFLKTKEKFEGIFFGWYFESID